MKVERLALDGSLWSHESGSLEPSRPGPPTGLATPMLGDKAIQTLDTRWIVAVSSRRQLKMRFRDSRFAEPG